MSLLYKIGSKPIIAAVRKPQDIELAIESQIDNLFFMGGTIQEIIAAVRLAKEAGKGTFVHPDLIKGLSSTDRETVSFIAEYVGADGIVSPKSHVIKEAKRCGLYGVLHLFVLDSLAFESGLRLIEQVLPDAVELMPGVIPKIIQRFSEAWEEIPIIASGLIQTKAEAELCLQAGATSLSVSEPLLWSLTFEDLEV